MNNEKIMVEYLPITQIEPYPNNPRHNDDAVDAVASSIREFGFKVPIIIDENNVIIAGHTRLKAAKQLGMTEVPVIRASDLTDDQVKAFRLADNKVGELATWDMSLVDVELEDIQLDMGEFGFDIEADWFETRTRYDNEGDEDQPEEYQEFLEKYEPKRTTDDCYTPDIVYDAIADWVAKEYNLDRSNFVRPFYPGGDYQSKKYKPTDIVVDNPPFSIIAEILRFYSENGVRFFLFAPALTLFSSSSSSSCALPCGVGITYENGATVSTSFLTNLEDHRVRIIPELYKVVEEANDENLKQFRKSMPKYKYPDEVLTAAMCQYLCKYGQAMTIERSESFHYRQLDAQKEYNGSGIYGSGYLLSEKAAAEKAAAEKAAAEKAAATVWQLSEREKEIVASLG